MTDQHSRLATGAPLRVGRYVLFSELASGGMGAVHLGRLIGAAGFSRTVAIKRLHRHLATNDEFVTMFMDEARIASRIHHTNVIPTLEVVLEEGELLLVMEYLDGEPLSRLQRASRAQGGPLPVAIAVSVMVGALRGLHAAHEARSERGEPLGIVHRDISPQNIMVGSDGVARVVDFGIAKAASRATVTGDAVVKGKLTYMAPEQLEQATLDRRTDVFAAAIVLWELLTGQRLFAAEEAATSMQLILEGTIPAPGTRRAGLPGGLDAAVLRALARSPGERFPTALEFAEALEKTMTPATQGEVGRWVATVAADSFEARAQKVAEIETASLQGPPIPAPAPAPRPAEHVEPSQVSSLAVVSTNRARSGQMNLLAVLGCIVLGVGAAAAPFLFIPQHPADADGAPVAGSRAALPSSQLPAASSAAGSASALASAEVPLPLVPASATTAPPRVAPTRPSKGAGGAPGKGGGSAGAAPDCSIPYVILPDGTKRFRAECVK